MANAKDLKKSRPARIMLVGYPGTGKTGALACLANAGYKLRVLDFDGNLEPLLLFTEDDSLENIDILSFHDELRGGLKSIEPKGRPDAFAEALKAMDHWKYTDGDGNDVDLGRSKDWGPDTVVVLDSLTSMGRAAMRRAMSFLNKTPLNRTDQTWGFAMQEQEAFIEKLASPMNKHHVIVTAHLKMLGPKEVRKGDNDVTIKAKEEAAELVPTRLFPSALGRALPPQIGGHFPTLLLVEPKFYGSKVKRVIHTLPRPELDLKVPAPDLPATVPIEDGLVTIFNKLKGETDG